MPQDNIAELLPAFERYMATATRLLPTTRKGYLFEVTLFFTKEVELAKVSQVTPQVLLDWQAALHSGYAAQATIVRKKAALRRFFNYLEDFQANQHAGLLARTLAKIEVRSLQTVSARAPYVLSGKQVQRMLETALKRPGTGRRDRAILSFLLSTGVRRAGLIGLELSTLDLANRTAMVHEKGDKTREVIFDPTCQENLQAWLEERPRWKPTCDNLFITIHGGPIAADSLSAMVGKIAEDAGLRKNVWPHLFRHSAISGLLNSGMAIQEVAVQAGHTNVNTTFRYYHPDKGQLKENYDKATAKRAGRKKINTSSPEPADG